MFDAPRRPLVFPLKNPVAIEAVTPEGLPECEVVEFPEDSDEKVTVLFRLSLNEYVALASAIDVGADIAFGADAPKIWWLWVTSIMCAAFCEEMAECINDPESAFTLALAEQLRTNPNLAAAVADAIAQSGAAVPGRSLTPGQSATSILPPSVFDEFGECIPDALWGAILYLVQSGNRAITDLNEILESLSNTLETSAIISQTIPAAGQYVSAAAEFADQMRENIAEGYAAAYTESYENDLACDIFCAASENCELTPDMLVDIMAARMPDPIDVASFGLIMATVGTIIIPPENIADSAFLVYFSALKFGQQYGEVVGIRPLSDLMGLGADQLASDNWETLCDCVPSDCLTYDRDNAAGWTFTDSGEAASPLWREAAAGTNMQGQISGLSLTGFETCTFEWDLSVFDVVGYSYIRVITNAGTHSYSGSFTGPDTAHSQAIITGLSGETVQSIEYLITGGSAATSYQLRFIELCP